MRAKGGESGNFSPENLQLVEKLLRLIYELAANP